MAGRKIVTLVAALSFGLGSFAATTDRLGADEPSANDREFAVKARFREKLGDGGQYRIRETELRWDPARTAIIICDMWNKHWCAGANRRVGEMVGRMNRVVAEARRRGALVIHSPSGCMEAYAGTPQRRRAEQAPKAANQPAGIGQWLRALPGEPCMPIDDSDGGCDCQPPCKNYKAWTRQIDAIDIAEQDAVSDSGEEIWNLLEQRGIDNVVVMGVHVNMCVLGRPFGLRQMASNGKNVVLVRDLTDSMYNPRQEPRVAHRRGTELVVEHIEKHVCPSVLSADLTGEAEAPEVVFLIGEKEYNTRETLPQFARRELAPLGVESKFVQVDPKKPNDFQGLEALRDADLMVLSVRRRTPTEQQLAMIRDYLDSGKPLVAVRTASHAFAAKAPAGHAAWPEFDGAVLGGNYHGHYGHGSVKITAAPGATSLPILTGVKTPFESDSHLYKASPLAETATPLLMGAFEKNLAEPVAWTNAYKGGRVFYTSLGGPGDFENSSFRRLLKNAVFWAMERQIPDGAHSHRSQVRATAP